MPGAMGRSVTADAESDERALLQRVQEGDHAAWPAGVVFNNDTLDIDDDATRAKRAELHARPSTSRPAYLEIFHDSLGIETFELVGERYLKV